MRALNGVFGLLFVFSAALQYNDPDPWGWAAVYLWAAGACIAWERGGLGPAAPGRGPGGTPLKRARGLHPVWWALPGVCLTWSGTILAGMTLQVPLAQALTDWGMHTAGSEEAREIGGLWIVAAWTGFLLCFRRPRA